MQKPVHADLSQEEVLRMVVRAERRFNLPNGFKVYHQEAHNDPYGSRITLRTPTKSYEVSEDLLREYKKSLPSLDTIRPRPISAERPRTKPNRLSYDDIMDASHFMHSPHAIQSQREAEHQKRMARLLMDSKPMVPPFNI